MLSLDKDLNDHIVPRRKFYKTKTFWLAVSGLASAVLLGDYSHAVPLAIEIFSGVVNG